jgi:hypothetical protein
LFALLVLLTADDCCCCWCCCCCCTSAYNSRTEQLLTIHTAPVRRAAFMKVAWAENPVRPNQIDEASRQSTHSQLPVRSFGWLAACLRINQHHKARGGAHVSANEIKIGE